MQTKSKFSWHIALLFLALTASSQASDFIPLGSAWKHRLGTSEASSPIDAWRQLAFDDSSWSTGGAPIGYDTGGTPGTAPIITTLPDPRTAGNPAWTNTYFRKTFNVAQLANVIDLTLTIFVDDGAVAWLNGTEILRVNVPNGNLTYLATATGAGETLTVSTTNIASLLVPGNNVVAVHAFNGPASSSDFVFEADLTAVEDLPPTVLAIDPPPSGIVVSLTFVNIIFTENVSGVEASDLLINTLPAASVTQNNPRDYTFNFPEPPTGAVTVAWASNPSIVDTDGLPNDFVPGPGWSYTLDPNAIAAEAIISEFLADNENGRRDEDGDRGDWIEIYNSGVVDLNLGGWFLTDTPVNTNAASITNLTKWRFPSINLGANKYLLVWADEKDRKDPAAPLHTNFKLGKNAGGYLALVDTRTNIVSEFSNYVVQVSDVSYGRDRVDPNLVGYFITPTPGAQNSTSGAGFAGEPVLSLESGIYTNNSLTLTITAPAGITVRYTLDATEPTNNSPAYTGPITFTTNMVLKARGYSASVNVWPSPVVARTFILLDATARAFNSNLPLLIISTQGRAIPRNLAPGTARPRGVFAAIETYRGRSVLQGKADFQEFGQFEVIGQTSADFAKQPIRIEVNDELGNDKEISVLGLPAEADWNLRNPHNDKTLMNDFLGYELWEDMGHYSCRRRFVELFLDTGGGKLTYPGDYYGVMVLFERIEIGKDRVDIPRLTPSNTNEPSITGGYIFKKDKDSTGDLNFSTAGGAFTFTNGTTITTNTWPGEGLKMHEPKPNDLRTTPGGTTLTPSGSNQLNYLRSYLNRMERSMYSANWTNATGTNHYSYYMDVDAFVDQQLHVEFTKQIDGYRLSGYYSKDRNGKVKPEPVWDWNLAFGNANYLQGGKTNGWYWNISGEGMTANEHIWLRRLVYGLPAITSTAPWTTANGPGDPDFRQKITDRWDVLRTNVLNGSRVVARINELEALLTESAGRNWTKYPGVLNVYQWPNPEGAPSWDVDFTKLTYAEIVSEMRKWVNGRFTWMDNQFLATPVMSMNGGTIQSGFQLAITAAAGSIYYKVDGTDPRAPGGGISLGATLYTGPIVLPGNARVVARALTASTTPLWTPWSAPVAATFVVETPKLVITEIMYHPLPPPLGSTNLDEDFEYIEFKNVGTAALDIGGFTISGGIEFTFPSRTLAVGERVVVVANRYTFTNRYGASADALVAGEFTGRLANEGNRLILRGSMLEPILDFEYDDQWHPITDGFGFSLVVVDENAPVTTNTWGLASGWRPGGTLNGTPGQDESVTTAIPRVVISEALSHSDLPGPTNDVIELLNLSGGSANVSGWYLTDDFRTPRKFRIPVGTAAIPDGGTLTFDETAFNVGVTGFSLSSSGDEVYLFSADADGELTGYAHGFSFGAQRTAVTFVRHVNSQMEEHFVASSSATLGTANAPVLIGPVVITEIMYRPPDVFANGANWNNSEDEFVELRNISGAPVGLFDPARPTNTWKLDRAVEFNFPTNVTIPNGGYALVVNFNPVTDIAQRDAFRSKYGISAAIPLFGPYQGDLSNGDETVALYRPDAPENAGANAGEIPYVLVDEVRYSDQAPWPVGADGYGPSLQRIVESNYGNDPANWTAVGPSAGASFISGGIPPTVTSQPVGFTRLIGLPGSLSVAVSGTEPFTYQWRFNGTTLSDGPNLSGANRPVLTFPALQADQVGDYSVIILNSGGSAESVTARVRALFPPSITVQPTNQAVRIRPDPNSAPTTNVAFTAVATSGNSQVAYQWRFNGADLPGANSTTLMVTDVQLDEEGDYTCAISDSVTTVYSATARLSPLISLSFVQPPLSQTVVAGSDFSQSVELTGNPLPIAYSWRRGSVVIATNSGNYRSNFITLNSTAAGLILASNMPSSNFNTMRLVVFNQATPGGLLTTWTNTLLADFDRDGIPDVVENSLGLSSSNAADGALDLDGDGMSNQAEYTAGTDPTNHLSYLQIQQGPGAATVRVAAVSNRTYSVQFTDDLNSGLWSRLADIVARPNNRVESFTDPTWTTNRFYRVAVPRQP